MAYTALYRKFRPGEFEDVKGQEHIITTLKNQIKVSRIGHAYLFCGTRGTGKTTVAKILAKSVNCEKPVEGSPCGQCALCKAIAAGTSLNVIEIDAASNNGVDNIREIVEEVQYSPTEGRYKVYIIDEVHMLSTGAFNALLKTLEEPPPYVIFILATTEVHKIPVTILSRCQRYDFRRITIEIIVARLKELMDKEQIEAEEKALKYVAKAADGSMRDALSLLDQCIAFYLGEKLTFNQVLDVLGAVDTEVFGQMYQYIRENNITQALEQLEQLMIGGIDLSQFVNDFTWYFRNLLLLKTSASGTDMIDVSTDRMEQLQADAAASDLDLLIRFIRIFSELSGQMKYAAQKRIAVEVALIKLCRPAMENNYESLLQRVLQMEKQLEQGMIRMVKQEISDVQLKAREKETERVTDKDSMIKPESIPEDLKTIAENWNHIIAQLSPLVKATLSGAKPTMGGENGLLLLFEDAVDKECIDREEHLAELRKVIEERTHSTVEIRTKLIKKSSQEKRDYVDLSNLIKMEIDYID